MQERRREEPVTDAHFEACARPGEAQRDKETTEVAIDREIVRGKQIAEEKRWIVDIRHIHEVLVNPLIDTLEIAFGVMLVMRKVPLLVLEGIFRRQLEIRDIALLIDEHPVTLTVATFAFYGSEIYPGYYGRPCVGHKN